MKKPRPIPPGPDQESVWDYPRPPRVEDAAKRITIRHRGVVIADTTRARRVLETSHPPVYYIPKDDIDWSFVKEGTGKSFCEWKGQARYYDVILDGEILSRAAWSYPSPTRAFLSIKDHLAFYPAPFDECLVGGEEAVPQPGGFYGGWITMDIVGPFKGETGTELW